MIASMETGAFIRDRETAEFYFPIFKKAGFDAVDFNLDGLYPGVYERRHSELFDLPHDELMAIFAGIKDAADKSGITFGQMHAPFASGFVGEDEFNAYMLDVIKKSIEICALCECKYLVIHPIIKELCPAYTLEDEHRTTIEFYTKLMPTLKEYGVVACLENMWTSYRGKIYGAVCSDFREVNDYIAELNSIAGGEYFGFCFDSGHTVLAGTSLYKAIHLLGNNIKVVHLHDVDGVHDNHSVPYDGVSNWSEILTSLRDIGYAGTMNFESVYFLTRFPTDCVPEAIMLQGAVAKHFQRTYFA